MSIPTENIVSSSLMPILYIPHGGGPLPLMGEEQHKELIEFLGQIPRTIKPPKALVIISAHWESNLVSISSSANPGMIYDYGGFPQETYQYQYPAPGQPELARHIGRLFAANDIDYTIDPERGYDHGTFVPLMLMYPKADVPVVQVSLVRSFDPLQHIKIGQALSSLREQGVLIIGSGMSFHHFNGSNQDSLNFDNWLTNALTDKNLGQSTQHLIDWETAPSARESHAREEHLLPLHVCFGASIAQNTPAVKVFSGLLFDKKISAFMWQ
ncbi:MAG: class III extradiol ring-cleavage dioxygenase [Paraglaciecola polaris]|uniref:DODA-type extradiol aromatic ring-opening family dioxygenase n=1 Tax=Paraglaciecola polaris TaxID=222814 RepID=UPI00300300C2|tara:strand:- start:4684 stop:5490 length:807 start_codon:yes stop_codon:yes gene_type:complete